MTTMVSLFRASSQGQMRNLAHLAQTKSRLDIAKKAKAEARAEPMARINVLKSAPKPCNSRGHSNQEVVAALGIGPHFEALMLSMIKWDAQDIHLAFREDQGQVRVKAMIRVKSERIDHTVSELAEDWVSELVETFVSAGDKFKKDLSQNDFCSAVLEREMEHLIVKLRIQSVPVYPKGRDVIIRLKKRPRPNESERASEMKRQWEVKALFEEANTQGQQALSKLAKAWNQETGDGKSLSRRVKPRAPKGFKSIKKDLKNVARDLRMGMDSNAMCYRVVGGVIIQSFPLLVAAERNDPKAIKELLAAGADPDQVNEQGKTPLACACILGHLQAVAELLPVSWVDAQSFSGNAALAEAALTGQVDVVRLLVGCSAVDLGQGVIYGAEAGGAAPEVTALWLGASRDYFKCCQILIEHGADPRLRSAEGVSLVQNAIDQGASDELVAILKAQALRFDERDALNDCVAHQVARGPSGRARL